MRPETFLQVNPGQTERLYAMALEWVAPEKDEVLLDLYCGVGTMTLLAARTCAKAVGVDIVAASIERAKLNAKRNGIENAVFHAGAVEDELPRLIASGIRPAAAILDPAFKGLEETVPAMLTAPAAHAIRLRLLQPEDLRARCGKVHRARLAHREARARGPLPGRHSTSRRLRSSSATLSLGKDLL